MFQQGQRFVYGVHGVCEIIGTEMQSISRKKVEYYVLKPVGQTEARFYVPMNNETALAKLYPLLTRQELDDILRNTGADAPIWISDENQRKQHYKEIIGSYDRAALICMVRYLYKYKQQQLSQGKKFHMCDENFLREAERMLGSEMSLVFGVPQNEVATYIVNNE